MFLFILICQDNSVPVHHHSHMATLVKESQWLILWMCVSVSSFHTHSHTHMHPERDRHCNGWQPGRINPFFPWTQRVCPGLTNFQTFNIVASSGPVTSIPSKTCWPFSINPSPFCSLWNWRTEGQCRARPSQPWGGDEIDQRKTNGHSLFIRHSRTRRGVLAQVQKNSS